MSFVILENGSVDEVKVIKSSGFKLLDDNAVKIFDLINICYPLDNFRISFIRMIIILSSTLLTASSVSVYGMVGWVGLVVPHMARFLVGPNFQVLIPTSGILGALFLLVVDDIARCMFPVEVPLGILTALIGAPFFLYLLMKSKRSWL